MIRSNRTHSLASSVSPLWAAGPRRVFSLLAGAALCVSLAGCGLNSAQLAGPDTSAVKVALNINGTVRGGQNPITGSAVQLWAVGSSGYGSTATNVIGLISGSSYCSVATDTITAYVITAGTSPAPNTVTFTGANVLTVGQTFSVSGLTSAKGQLLDGATYIATAVTANSFSANTTVAAAASTTDSGTATPQCGNNEVAASGTGNEVVSDGAGSFSITGDYTCPSSTSQMYLTAIGGNPGLVAGTNNTAIKLITPLGPCGKLSSSTSVILSEVTTAATAFAMGQYFSATNSDSFGAPSTAQAQTGLANAIATVSSLVSLASGNAITSTTLTGAGYTLTAVPDSAKLNTIADVLAACVNSKGASDPNANCTTLFADVVPTGGTAVTNVLEAAVDMSLNPTSNNANGSATNLTALYNLSTGTGSPFTGLSAAPTDWTVGIQYQDPNQGAFFIEPQQIAVDSLGNVWVLNADTSSSVGTTGVGGLVQVSPTGTPLSNISSFSEIGPYSATTLTSMPPALSSPKTTTTTIATTSYVYTTTFGTGGITTTTNGNKNPVIAPRNLAIDPSNNVWFTASSSGSSTTGGPTGTTTVTFSGDVVEVSTTGGLPNGTTAAFATGKSAYALTIDGAGDVFTGQQSSSAVFGTFEFPAGNLLAPIGLPPNNSTQIEYAAVDLSGNLWLTQGNTTGTAYEITSLNQVTCGTASTPTTVAACPTPLTTGSLYQPVSTNLTPLYTSSSSSGNTANTIALNSGGQTTIAPVAGITGSGMFFANTIGYIEDFPYAGGPVSKMFGSTTTLATPQFLAADGAGNLWVGNHVGNPAGIAAGTAGAVAGGSVSEITSAGTVLSPATSNATLMNPGFVHTGINFAAGIAIDPSGNVWVANAAPYAVATGTAAASPSSIFEIVGAAVPVVTPVAATTGYCNQAGTCTTGKGPGKP